VSPSKHVATAFRLNNRLFHSAAIVARFTDENH
jgi:hypothetical protein